MLPLGETDEGYMKSLCIISYNCMWIYYYFQIKSRKKKGKQNLYEERYVTSLRDIKDLSIQVTHKVRGEEIQY